jgi:hypothetical protein
VLTDHAPLYPVLSDVWGLPVVALKRQQPMAYRIRHLLPRDSCHLATHLVQGFRMCGHAGVHRQQPLSSSRPGGVEQIQHKLRVPLEVLILNEEAHAALKQHTELRRAGAWHMSAKRFCKGCRMLASSKVHGQHSE